MKNTKASKRNPKKIQSQLAEKSAESQIPQNLPAQIFCPIQKVGMAIRKQLERFLLKNQHTQGKSLNFEFWIDGKLSKLGH